MSKKTITAVVCAYWQERSPNVDRIVQDLLAGSVTPDKIVVLDNGAKSSTRHWQFADERVVVIEPGENTETRGKFVAGLLSGVTDYYVMCDDDTSVGRLTLEAIMSWAEQLRMPLGTTLAGRIRLHPEFVTGYWGCLLQAGSFSKGTIVVPDSVSAPTRVDAFHGRVVVASFGALVNMLEAERKVRLRSKWKRAGDDLLIGLANHDDSWLLPLRGDEHFVDLTDGGVAMQHREGYFDERDAFAREAIAALDYRSISETT